MTGVGLYQHVVAEELESPSFRGALAPAHDLITIRGSEGRDDAVRSLIGSKGDTLVFLYRMGTAVSEETGEELKQDHPGWVAEDRSGKVVTSRPGNYVINITNPEVRAWLVSQIESSVGRLGYDGVYLDVLGSFFSERFYSARPVVEGGRLEDADWRDASIALVNEVKRATGKPVFVNGFGVQSGKNYEDHRADSDKLIEASDGIQIEQFTRTGDMALSRSKNPEAWRSDLELVAKVSGQDKLVLVNTRVKESSDDAALARVRDFALASFLIASQGPALFQFGGTGAGNQAETLNRAIKALGAAAGPPEEFEGASVRRFANGVVAANPSRGTVQVEIGGEAVELQAGEGLLRVGAGGPPVPTSPSVVASPEPSPTESPSGAPSEGTPAGGAPGPGLLVPGMIALAALALVVWLRTRRNRADEGVS